MAYIEIKKIKGRLYRYERRSYREKGKVKHTSKYLGSVEPINKRRNPNAGRKPKLKIRELSSEEFAKLQTFLHSTKSFEKDRANILLLSAKANTVKDICKKTGFHRPKVEKIIKDFNRSGFEIFVRKKSPGRPRRITKEERGKIVRFVNTDPRHFSLPFTTWSLNTLAEYSNKKGIMVSPSQVRRILRQDNITYKKRQKWLYSNDPEFLKKNF